MIGLSLSDKFKSLDIYRKLPGDIVQPTFSGALLSIISSVLMVLLILSEYKTFLEVKTNSEMYIDINRGGDKLNINVDIEMLRIPCSIISLDLQDIMGSHTVNIHGSLMKYKLDKNGQVMGESLYKTKSPEKHGEDHHDEDEEDEEMPDYEEVKKHFQNQEGCQLKGYFLVNKVPGNFHISAHAYGSIIQRLASEGVLNFDVAHKINHLSFGDDKDMQKIRSGFSSGELNPLDGIKKAEYSRKVYEYYMKVVPTTYIDLYDKSYYVNQFTYNSNEVHSNMMLPAVYFRYDMSPITVEYRLYKENFLHFLIQLCAIVGGIFSVTGIIDALIHSSVAALMKKANMGKLG